MGIYLFFKQFLNQFFASAGTTERLMEVEKNSLIEPQILPEVHQNPDANLPVLICL